MQLLKTLFAADNDLHGLAKIYQLLMSIKEQLH